MRRRRSTYHGASPALRGEMPQLAAGDSRETLLDDPVRQRVHRRRERAVARVRGIEDEGAVRWSRTVRFTSPQMRRERQAERKVSNQFRRTTSSRL